jgi:hypothetical protein
MNTGLKETFETLAREVLENHKDLVHEWSRDGGSLILKFPKQEEKGFDVIADVDDLQIIIVTDEDHRHFDQIEDAEATVADVLGLVRDLLCEDMRLLVFFSGSKPYRWTTEQFDGTKWIPEHTGGLLFWNYFGRRSQKLLQNRTLPSRLNV